MSDGLPELGRLQQRRAVVDREEIDASRGQRTNHARGFPERFQFGEAQVAYGFREQHVNRSVWRSEIRDGVRAPFVVHGEEDFPDAWQVTFARALAVGL